MGSERGFSRRTREALKKGGCRCYSIETGSTASGIPDLLVLHKGGTSLVELKSRPDMMLSMLSCSRVGGPGQSSFAAGLARATSFRIGGLVSGRHSFMLIECMDGVGLMVTDAGGLYLAACWESLPSGADLSDALRSWSVSVMPSVSMADESVGDCYAACADAYSCMTGIMFSLEGVKDGQVLLGEAGGSVKALEIARDLCDRGRLALLMLRMKEDAGGCRAVPVDGSGGYVILGNGG